jgi:flagellar motor switch protein FliM
VRFSGVPAAAGAQIERVPRLPSLLEEASESIAASLAALSPACKLTFADCGEGNAVDVLGAGWADGFTGQIDGEGGTPVGYVIVSRRSAYELCDRALGGKLDFQPGAFETAPTRIETRFISLLSSMVAEALTNAFRQISPEFSLSVSDVRQGLSLTDSPQDKILVFVAWLELDFGAGPQKAAVLLRQSAIAPMRDMLKVVEAPSNTARSSPDHVWVNRIQREVSRTHVGVSAVLEERQITLGQIASLKVGDVLKLDATVKTLVRVESEGLPLFRCEMGKRNGVLVLSLHSPIDPEEELLATLTGG